MELRKWIDEHQSVTLVLLGAAIGGSRYQTLGGTIELIAKPGVGHHPHSLKDLDPDRRLHLETSKELTFGGNE